MLVVPIAGFLRMMWGESDAPTRREEEQLMRFLIDHACAVVDTVSLGPSLLAVSLAVGSMAIPLGLAAAA